MAWTPDIQVFDETGMKDGLITYFEDNQTEALAWANQGASPALAAIRDFHKSPRLTTVFPALTFLQTNHTSDFEDLLTIDFNIILQLALVHGNQGILADIATKYVMALESMLVNAPKTTFDNASIITINAVVKPVETLFDVQGKLKKNNQFIQLSETRAGWIITANARA